MFPLPPSRLPKFIAVALFCLTALVFSRSIFSGFQSYDDPDYILNNAHIKSGLNWTTVRWAFTATSAANWHPLTWLSHTLDWSLYGDRPAGHHATSVLLHALNAAIAFLALRRLTKAVWLSAACAALFALHPLRVESVAWIAERKDVLSGLFWWLSLWAYAEYTEKRAAGSPFTWRWYTATLCAFALGLLSKPMLVTLPCVLLLLDFWPLGRLNLRLPANSVPASKNLPVDSGAQNASIHGTLSLFSVLVEKLPFFALSIGSSFSTYFAQQHSGAVSQDLPLGARLGNGVFSIVRYVGKFLWPADLSVFYPHPGYWPMFTVVTATLLVLAATALALRPINRRPWVASGWLWFVGTLVPVLGFVQVGMQSMADRYTYLPIFGLQIALVWGFGSFFERTNKLRQAGIALFSLWLLVLIPVTWRQQAVWKDPYILFQHAIRVTENNFLAWNNLGAAFSEQGKYAEAIPYYQKAVELNPTYALAHANLASAQAKTGAPVPALERYKLALQLNPDLLVAHRGYATSLTDAGRLTEALAEHRFILEHTPDDLEALNGCGMVLQLLGQNGEAEKMFLAALALSPNLKNTDTHTNLGTIYATTGRVAEAIREYRAVIAQTPNSAQVHNNLANALVTQGNLEESITHYQRAIELRPENVEARFNLGIVYNRLGRYYDARDILREAQNLRPDLPQIRSALNQVEARITLFPNSAPKS